MLNTTEKTQNEIIEQIIFELSAVPIEYLKTLHAIIHSFRTNLPTEVIDNKSNIKATKILTTKKDIFDWDNLIDEIHTNRKQNNEKMFNRINNII